MPVHLRGYVVEQTTGVPPTLKVLGAGSFGVVVKATNVNGEAVALKIMACMTFDGPGESVVNARKERDTLGAIGPHQNVMQLKGWEELDPTHAEVALAGPLLQGIEAWMRSEREIDPNRTMPKDAYLRTHTFCIAALRMSSDAPASR